MNLRRVLVAGVVTVALAAGGAGAYSASAAPAKSDVQAGPQNAKKKVLMDVDMGELNDDAAAMFLLGQSDRTVDLLGVTTVSGNTWQEEGTAYSLRQLELIKEADVPVVEGAKEPLMGSRQDRLDAEQKLYGNSEYIGSWDRKEPKSYRDLDKAPYGGYPKTKPTGQAAADFIARQVKKYPHQVTLFALGPATNVALAVRTHPEIVPLVKEVIYMGGAFDIPGNTTPAAEFNWWYDPEAAKIALRTPFPKQTIVPNDVAERVNYTKKEYDRVVAGPNTPITKMFKDLQGPEFKKDPKHQSYVWDSLTAAIFLDRSIATDVQQRYADVDATYGPDYGRALGYGASRNRDLDDPKDFPAGTQKVNIVFDIDRTKFWNLYVDKMTAPVKH